MPANNPFVFIDTKVLQRDGLSVDSLVTTELMFKVFDAYDKNQHVTFVLFSTQPTSAMLTEYDILKNGYQYNATALDVRHHAINELKHQLKNWFMENLHLDELKKNASFKLKYQTFLKHLEELDFDVIYLQPELFANSVVENEGKTPLEVNDTFLQHEALKAFQYHLTGVSALEGHEKQQQYQAEKITLLKEARHFYKQDPLTYWHQKVSLICEIYLRQMLKRTMSARIKLNIDEKALFSNTAEVYLQLTNNSRLPNYDQKFRDDLIKECHISDEALRRKPTSGSIQEAYRTALNDALLFAQDLTFSPATPSSDATKTQINERLRDFFGLPNNLAAYRELENEWRLFRQFDAESQSAQSNSHPYQNHEYLLLKKRFEMLAYNFDRCMSRSGNYHDLAQQCENISNFVTEQQTHVDKRDNLACKVRDSFAFYSWLLDQQQTSDRDAQISQLNSLTAQYLALSDQKVYTATTVDEPQASSTTEATTSMSDSLLANQHELTETPNANINDFNKNLIAVIQAFATCSGRDMSNLITQLESQLERYPNIQSRTKRGELISTIWRSVRDALGIDALLNDGLNKIATAVTQPLNETDQTTLLARANGGLTNDQRLTAFFINANTYLGRQVARSSDRSSRLFRFFTRQPTQIENPFLIVIDPNSVAKVTLNDWKKQFHCNLAEFQLDDIHRSSQQLHTTLELDGRWKQLRDWWWNHWKGVTIVTGAFTMYSLGINFAALDDHNENDTVNTLAYWAPAYSTLVAFFAIQSTFLLELLERRAQAFSHGFELITSIIRVLRGSGSPVNYQTVGSVVDRGENEARNPRVN